MTTSGVLSGKTLTQISAGNGFTCALDSTGVAYCWGNNASGQLGNGTTTSSDVPVAIVPGPPTGMTAFPAAASASVYWIAPASFGIAGSASGYTATASPGGATCTSTSALTCTITGLTNGTTYTITVVTNTTVSNSSASAAATVTPWPPLATIATGSASSCTIYSGKAYCWGDDTYGELGNNTTTTTPQLSPQAVYTGGALAGVTLTQIVAGANFTCALSTAGAVYCWGLGTSGQLGDSTNASSDVPVAVTATSGTPLYGVTVTKIDAGSASVCALSSAGAVYCWGLGTSGQLGDSANTSSDVPVAVTATSGTPLYQVTVAQISAGGSSACAVGSTGVAYCWGAGGSGQLGNGTATAAQETPVAVTATSGTPLYQVTVTQISVGGSSVCAVSSTGVAYCWGAGGSGQLGNGTATAAQETPVAVTATSGTPLYQVTVTQITAGSAFTCAQGATGTAYCWGANTTGQVGNDSTTQENTAVLVGPQAPTSVTTTAANTSAAVSWTAPVFLNNGTLTGYTATASPGAFTCTTTSATSCTITGLTSGATYSVTVTATATTGTSAPSTAASVTVLVTSLTIVKTANVTSVAPGGTVSYTVTVTNSGQTPYTGATFTDPLTSVLGNAVYNGNAAATAGTVSYSSPTLTWAGNLAVGASATITYSVTVNSPDTGSGILTNTVTSTTPGSNCASGSGNASCTATVTVYGLTIVKSANVSSITPGGTVDYTITVTNSGQTPYTAATFTDPLTSVLANATYDGNAAATAGSLSYSSPTLTWAGNLAVGASVTITYSVTVDNPDTGNLIMTNIVTSTAAGSNCASGSADARCTSTVTVLVPALTIVKTASASAVVPGATVGYTITVTDSGQTPYTGATVTDSLAGVLGNAAYNGDAAATTGTVTYASPTLTWTGNLAVGATATITYSVTVDNPDTGSKVMTNTAVSSAAGSSCPADSGNAACTATVAVLTPALTITKTANLATSTPGGTVSYTITVTDSGQTPYTGATVTDDLTSVLGNAAYNNDASATAGTVTYASPTLTWNGNLAVGATATITYSVTINNPDTGSGTLTNTVTSTTAGSNCAPGSTDTRCTTTVTVAQLTIVNQSNVSTTTPGGVVRFTATFTNSGQVPYTGITIATNASNVLDNATVNGDQTATSGTLTIVGTSVSWTGNIPVGGTVTVTGTVTVDSTVPLNTVLTSTITTSAPGSNCPPGGTDPRCSVSVTVLTPALTIVKTASASAVVPGATVGYTITVTDSGQTPYTGAAVTDSLAGVLGNAAYNGDAAATAGTVSYSSPTLTWTGNLAVGATATITYSVTVDNPDTGSKVMTNTAVSSAAGSSCPADSGNAACTATVVVLTPALTITKTASTATATPGQTVTYTITVADTGQTPYTGAAVADDLTGVLDDAAYNGDAAATAGTVTVTSPDLTWTGNLAVGATATITYSVTVDNPDTGTGTLTNTVTSTAAGSNCAPGSTDPRCTVTIDLVGTQTLTFTNTANVASTTPGGTVDYTIMVANSGLTPYTGATFTDDLTSVLANAAYNGDAAATAGTVSYSSPDLTWTGTVPAGGTVSITYSVTVDSPDTGNMILSDTISSSSPDSDCGSGSTDPRCTVTFAVAQLLIVIQASVSSTTPGGVIRFTSTFTNTGQVPYTGITIVPNASAVLDYATPNGDQTATSGTLSVTTTSVSWTGSIPVGGTVTISGSVTVDSTVPLNTVLTATDTTTAAGSNCPPGGTDPRCTVSIPVLTPTLTITKTANTTYAVPGQTVTYTIIVADSGQTPYTGATVTDSLAGVLGDAAYNGDAAATAGTVSYSSPDLTWTGNLAVGATATITYSVTVDNPDTGGKVMTNTAVSAASGSTCPAGSGNAACTAIVAVLTPALTITKTANVATTTPGGTVDYTITVADTGQTPYAGATVTDSLAGVLGDAAYNGDAAATAGTASHASPDLTWTGNLAVGATATITYSVTVDNPDTGTGTVTNTVTSTAAGSNCAPGSTDPRCTVTVAVAQLLIVIQASVSSTTPGGVIRFTSTFTNTGQVPYTGITIVPNASAVLDYATPNGDQTATSGTLTVTTTSVSWTGSIPVGGTVTISGSVTVDSTVPLNTVLTATDTTTAAGSNCPPGGTDPRCTVSIPVLTPALTITKTANVSTTTPGSTVEYTIIVADSGQTPYTGATVTDDLTGILTDAAYNGDAAATAGTVSYSSPDLTWTGNLAVGATATITYSVTVDNPDTGDKLLSNVVTSNAAGSNCPADSGNAACTATVQDLIPALTITKTADTDTASPGGTVTYTITVADTGQTPYTGATVTDDLTSVLANATYNNDAAATAGSVSYSSPDLTWTGNLAVGGSVIITYSATVDDPETGDKMMVNTVTSAVPGSTCPSGTTNPACSVTVAVITGVLSISVPAGADLGAISVGATATTDLGTVTVTDNRALPGASWTATVSSTDFTNTVTPADLIPAGDASYFVNTLGTTTGSATFTPTPVTVLSGSPQAVVTATSANGDNSATWDPQIQVSVPGTAVVGTYTATITHSVS